jgi:hypothetical protein
LPRFTRRWTFAFLSRRSLFQSQDIPEIAPACDGRLHFGHGNTSTQGRCAELVETLHAQDEFTAGGETVDQFDGSTLLRGLISVARVDQDVRVDERSRHGLARPVMQLVARGVRSTAQMPTAFAKPLLRALPTIVQGPTVIAIASKIAQRHLNVAVLDAVGLLEELDLAVTIDALNGARHDGLVLLIIAPTRSGPPKNVPAARSRSGQLLRGDAFMQGAESDCLKWFSPHLCVILFVIP